MTVWTGPQEARARRSEPVTLTSAVIDKNQSFLGFLFFFRGSLSEIIHAPRAASNDCFDASDPAIAVASAAMLWRRYVTAGCGALSRAPRLNSFICFPSSLSEP
jgi:hypothetical protein